MKNLAVFFVLCFCFYCEGTDILPDPAKLGGIMDMNNYPNISLTELGGLVDLNGLGDWSEKGGPGAKGHNSTFSNWAQDGLADWDIGLKINLVQTGRRSAMNWITVAEDDCVAEGVKEIHYGGYCPLGRMGSFSVIGVCYTELCFSGCTPIGGITKTLVIIEKNFLEGPASDAEKRAVFTHEIGHCLGLRHPDDHPIQACTRDGDSDVRNCVMHSITSNRSTAARQEEIAAIQDVYSHNPLRDPTTDAHRQRYVRPDMALRRHHSFPDFYISGVIGNGAIRYEGEGAYEEAPHEPSGSVEKRAYIMRSDGIEEIHITHPNSMKEVHYTRQ